MDFCACRITPPLPALNFNHSPRDGRNIGNMQLIKALCTVYGLSTPLAAGLVGTAILLCGNISSLDTLAIHGTLEHDASLVHADALPGEKLAPIIPDPGLVEQFFSANPHGFTVESFAQARNERVKATKSLPFVREEISRTESAMAFLLHRNSEGVAPVEAMRQWLVEERLPDSYSGPLVPLGVISVMLASWKIGKAMNMLAKDT